MAEPTKTYTITQLITDYADLVDAITIRAVDRDAPRAFAAHLEEAAEVLEESLSVQEWLDVGELSLADADTWQDTERLQVAAAYVGDAVLSTGADQQVLLRLADRHLSRIDQTEYL